jgi:opacity protein-like surface antigen
VRITAAISSNSPSCTLSGSRTAVRRRRVTFPQLLPLAAVVCFSTSLARAQEFRVFVMGGGSFLKDERFFTQQVSGSDQFRSNYASGGKFIFGGEMSIGEILGVEGSYAFGHNNLRVTNLSESETLGYGVHAQRVSGNMMVHSPVAFAGVRPYGTAGLEYDHLGPTSDAKTLAFTEGFAGNVVTLGAANQFGFNFGGGVEWNFLPDLAARLDFRDHITGTATYGLPHQLYPVGGTAHTLELAAGLAFHFGK